MNKFTLDPEVQKEWTSLMQEGYEYSLEGVSLAAITIWGQLWDKMRTMLDSEYDLSIEELDNAFGQQRISNWSSDFEMELGNASREESSFAQKRIHFCTEYIARHRDQSDPHVELMKWAICESYFDLGEPEKGEQAFREQLTASPFSGWGWIRWSDHYGVLAREGKKDTVKAVQILEQAIEIEGLKDRYYVLERLEDLYAELGLHQNVSAVKQVMMELLTEDQDLRPPTQPLLPPTEKVVPLTSAKVGRNDSCPCGSNKKYKKCCGSNKE